MVVVQNNINFGVNPINNNIFSWGSLESGEVGVKLHSRTEISDRPAFLFHEILLIRDFPYLENSNADVTVYTWIQYNPVITGNENL